MLICTFGDAIRGQDTRVVQKINKQVEDCFGGTDAFKLNRRLRNNLHYKEVDKLSDSELERIDDFQRRYIGMVLSIFNENIKFKFGKWYRFIKWIADHTETKMVEEKKK
ncbi:MAG: hypothetical protein PUG71_07605 [bacterium]|nr:hypothetical protein [bacterium]